VANFNYTMKKRYFIWGLIIAVSVVQCAGEKKVNYTIPSYFTGERRTALMDNLEKGKILYKTNCGNCHGIFSKGKESVPNFTNREIQNYMNAYQSNDQKNHAVLKKLLPEEMSMILTFLRYRTVDTTKVNK
jgi:cytochrome c553